MVETKAPDRVGQGRLKADSKVLHLAWQRRKQLILSVPVDVAGLFPHHSVQIQRHPPTSFIEVDLVDCVEVVRQRLL